MRIGYLDCFAGISGDMFLGALLDAGVPPAVMHDAVAALGLGASLRIETVDRSGIAATKVHVLERAELAEQPARTHTHDHVLEPDDQLPEQRSHAAITHTHQLKTQHLHKTGHPHTHASTHTHDVPESTHTEVASHGHQTTDTHEPHGHGDHPHSHAHGRSLSTIRSLIAAAPLAEPVKRLATATFHLLGHSEAKIHNVPVDEIHFHEVGAVDAIVDIVAASAGIHHLAIGAWYSSPLNVGGGMVQCAHGLFPVPAPATADLLRGVPTYSAHIAKELVTPTGAALVRALQPTFGAQPAMQVDRIGYGAGTRDPKDFPNVLRLIIGESATIAEASSSPAAHKQPSLFAAAGAATVSVIEAALDDLSPQLLAFVAEQALAAGALDVMLTPVIMKKGRPGTLLTVLCDASQRTALESLILRETTTLGVRSREEQRICLERTHATVRTAFGSIRMKVGSLGGEELNVAPEFEDCRAAAAEHHVALKQVQQAAIAAYRNQATSPR